MLIPSMRPSLLLSCWLYVTLCGLSAISGVVDARLSGTMKTPLGDNKSAGMAKVHVFPLIMTHSKQVEGRRLEELEEDSVNENGFTTTQVDPLYQGYGTHYVDLWVGCPPQRQTVIIDTGSDIVGFPCSECVDCGDEVYHIDALFQEANSSCFAPVQTEKDCHFGYWIKSNETCLMWTEYQEGSQWMGMEAVDRVSSGGDHDIEMHLEQQEQKTKQEHNSLGSFPLHFGCQYNVTGLFRTQLEDGILGMSLAEGSFWRQMYNQGVIERPQFALCLAHRPHADRSGTLAGTMVLGGTDTRLHTTPMQFAQMTTKSYKYFLEEDETSSFGVFLESIYLQPSSLLMEEDGKEPIKVQVFPTELNNGGTIVDSGSTATFFPKSLRFHFFQVWQSITGWDYSKIEEGMEMTIPELLSLPTILVQMAPATTSVTNTTDSDSNDEDSDDDDEQPVVVVAMPPLNYMTYNAKTKIARSMFYMTQARDEGTVLGGNFMRGHDVLFDVENHRVGFAESDCDMSALLSEEDDESQ